MQTKIRLTPAGNLKPPPSSASYAEQMSWIESLVVRALETAEAETARNAAMRLLRLGLVPTPKRVQSGRLAVTVAGLELQNPLGLAAGFDKDAEALSKLARMGFGFIEIGAVTPRPQKGNSKPRLFRLKQDRAVINRLGFNSRGAKAAARRLAARPAEMVVGLNVGANKDSPDRIADYASVIQSCGGYVDFVTANVSSPNTDGLRSLQKRSELRELLELTKAARDTLAGRPKLFLKLSPDLPVSDLQEAAETAAESGVDAIIATNTMAVNRGGSADGSALGLTSRYRGEAGGLSGRPLFDRSTRTLGEIYHVTQGTVPLIGAGGIETADDAFRKIQAGAAALQIYTALIFHGFSRLSEILAGLDRRLEREGFNSVIEAVGTDNAGWRLDM